MYKFIISLIAILVLLNSKAVVCQTNISVSLKKLSKAVVYLQNKDTVDNKIKTNYGTGFFVKNENKLFLVTAEHIAKGLLKNYSLKTADDKGEVLQIPLTSKLNWIFSLDNDVAVTLITDYRLINKFSDDAIELSFLPNKLDCPDPEVQLMIIGFPLQFGASGKFSPIRRETNAASSLLDLERADTKKTATFFVTQDPSVQGYSGAPVFVIDTYLVGNTIMKGVDANICVGLVHGTSFDSTGGKMGLIVPGKYIYDLVKYLSK